MQGHRDAIDGDTKSQVWVSRWVGMCRWGVWVCVGVCVYVCRCLCMCRCSFVGVCGGMCVGVYVYVGVNVCKYV